MDKNYRINQIVRDDRMDNLWKDVFIKGYLSFREAARLSGVTNRSMSLLLKNHQLKHYIQDGCIIITWEDFFSWFSSRDVLKDNAFGRSSYSLHGLIRHTGKSRCWVLDFTSRYKIHSELMGVYRRFDKIQSDYAWSIEKVILSGWMPLNDALLCFECQEQTLLYLSARHKIDVIFRDDVLCYSVKDLKHYFTFKQIRYE